MLITDLVKLIGMNKPCIYLAPRGEVELYAINTRKVKKGIQYELLAVVKGEHTLTAWYDETDVLPDFKLLDWIE